MLTTYFFVGLAFAIPELIVVYNCPPLKRFIERNPIFELVVSLGLSILLATAMGVGVGVTLAVANVFATVITLAVYHLKLVERSKLIAHHFRELKAQVIKLYRDFHALISLIWKFISFPFVVLAKIIQFLNRGAQRIQR